MTRTLTELDEIAHDPLQTHLSSFQAGGRGPYPGHPAGRTNRTPVEASKNKVRAGETDRCGR